MGTYGKTIKEIAEEIGVSKQAIHQKRRKEPLSTDLQLFTSIVDGVIYITVDGEELIKSAFLKSDRKIVDINKPSTVDTNIDGILKETIDTLKLQLEAKDEQIQELMNTIRIQSEIIKAHIEKPKEKLIDEPLQKEKPMFGGIRRMIPKDDDDNW